MHPLAIRLLSFVTILSLILPSGLAFSPAPAYAQEAQNELATTVPVEVPAPQFPELNLPAHPSYGAVAEPAAEVVVGQPAPEIEASAVQAAAAVLDAEALKSGVVSGAASAILPADGSTVRLGNLPLLVRGPAVVSSAGTAEATVQANVWSAETAQALSPAGLVFTLTSPPAPLQAGEGGVQVAALTEAIQVTVDYSQIPLLHGGSFKERLTLFRVRNCVRPADITSEEAPCQTWEALPGVNNLVGQQLTVDLAAAGAATTEEATDSAVADPAVAPADPPLDNTTLVNKVYLPAVASSNNAPLAEEGEVLYVLAAAASGEQGSYKATPLANVGEYQVSLATGAAQSSYPIALPPAAGPLAPSIALNYDSGGVDGMNVNKNNQPGWVGIGWSWEPGYIVRRLKTCGTAQAPGDLCLTGDNYELVWGGVSSQLVKDGSGFYHAQNDPRWKIQKLTSSNTAHPDTQKEYWLLTTPDGTTYRFGGEFDTDKANAVQNSAFHVTVYDGTACSGVSAYWVCKKVWKWNLDRVQDRNGNVVAYYYNQETNYYNVRAGLFRWQYVRAGNIQRIEYGRRSGSATTPTQVLFNTEERCEGACVWPTNYPDTPGDLTCAATGTCTQNAPTFWSRLRLNTIQTQAYNQTTSQWQPVATTDLDYAFPTPPLDADGDSSEKKLWLQQITQKDGAGANPLPSTQYGYTMLKNRRDAEGAGGGGISSLIMPRLNLITLPLGGVVRFNYGQSHPCPNSQSGFVQYPYDCYPGWNTHLNGWTLWHKWKVVSQVMSDTFSLNDTQTLTFSYSTPVNHYDDDPVTPVANKTWSDFRGSQIVTVIDGSGAKTEHRFHRGMHGDNNGSGGTTTVTITDSNGEAHGNDSNWLRGRPYEVRRLTAANAARSRTANWYTSSLTVGSGRTGAYFVGPQKVDNVAFGTVNKTTRVEYTYDSYGNVTNEKLYGDTSTATDDRNIQRSFLAHTGFYVVDKPQWEKLWTGLTPGAANAEKSFVEYAYDGLAYGGLPTAGNPTKVKSYWQASPSYQFYEATNAYDAYGRPTTTTDARGKNTTTAYHSFYGYVTSVTNHLSHVVSSISDPGFGVPTQLTDANGKVTTLQYDTLGRLSKVWLPTEPTNGAASLEFVYNLTLGAYPASVKSRQLQSGSSYLENWGYVDGFGRELQSQSALLNGNRTVASTKYNQLGQTAYSSAPYEVTGAAGSGYVAPIWTSLSNYHYRQYEELGNLWLDETKSGTSVLWSTTTIHDSWQKRAYNPRGNRTDYDNDGFGKLAKVTEYNVGSVAYNTTYAYDLQGNLTGVTDHLGNLTTMGYDLVGRKTSMTDPDMGSWLYQYDAVGNLTGQRDARNLWLYLGYDDLNRLVSKRKDNATTGALIADYAYDAVGQKGLLTKSRAYNAAGTTVEVEIQSATYDNRNRLTQQNWVVNGAGTFRMDSSFNAADQKTSVTYPGGTAGQQGEVVSSSYNAIGQLTGVTGVGGIQYVASASYNAQGQMTQLVNEQGNGANGLTRQFVYNASTLRLDVLRAGTSGAFENLQKLTYTYDNNGNVSNVIDTVNSSQKQCFQYDWLDRLTGAFTGDATCAAYSATGTGAYNHTCTYNEVGNITSYAGNAYTYGDTAHKHAVTAAFGNTYGYDANGNQTTRTVGGVTHTFTFDYENRITAISGGSVSASFVYDANGNRVKGTVGGVTTVYIAGVYEYQGGATTLYYEGNALRRTGYVADNGVFYNLRDHLQSSSVLLNQNATVNGNRNYFFPFGGNRGGAAFNGVTTKRFTGQYHEKDLPGGEGLSYYGARWYDAQVGRFLSADAIVPGPANPQALNRYSYVFNNPLKYNDPSGHKPAAAITPLKPMDLTDSWGITKFFVCLFWSCKSVGERYVAFPVMDPMAGVPIGGLSMAPVGAAKTAGSTLLRFVRSGISSKVERVAGAVLREGDVIGLRTRPVLANVTEHFFPAKPSDAASAIKPIKEKIFGLVDAGIRKAGTERFVSDLDVAYVIRDGKLLSNDEVLKIAVDFNEQYGKKLITHGDLWNGANMGKSGIRPDHLYSDVFVYRIQGDKANFWFNSGFMESLANLLSYFPNMAQ